MASSRKRPSADVAAAAAKLGLHGKRVAVGLSGGVDSVTLLHLLSKRENVSAIHVHHGLSPNAERWAAFCRRLCRRLSVPLRIEKVKVVKRGKGLEAAAREARYAAFSRLDCDCIVLAHHLDDQAETVLMNLLRGAGRRGASGMPAKSRLGRKTVLRPLLAVPRESILAYARAHGLDWIEDESNADESLTRNFLRRRVAPLLDRKYPEWRKNLARAARHFAQREAGAQDLLRKFLRVRGLRAPSEAKLVEMLKQLTAKGSRTLIEHDGVRLRVYRGSIVEDRGAGAFAPIEWKGEAKLAIPELGGELRFKRGVGIDARRLQTDRFEVRLRSGGERLQPHARRPRRTLKNLFQEAGVPPWVRERMPLLFCGDDLVWAPGVGIDIRYQGPGLVPEWRVPA